MNFIPAFFRRNGKQFSSNDLHKDIIILKYVQNIIICGYSSGDN